MKIIGKMGEDRGFMESRAGTAMVVADTPKVRANSFAHRPRNFYETRGKVDTGKIGILWKPRGGSLNPPVSTHHGLPTNVRADPTSSARSPREFVAVSSSETLEGGRSWLEGLWNRNWSLRAQKYKLQTRPSRIHVVPAHWRRLRQNPSLTQQDIDDMFYAHVIPVYIPPGSLSNFSKPLQTLLRRVSLRIESRGDKFYVSSAQASGKFLRGYNNATNSFAAYQIDSVLYLPTPPPAYAPKASPRNSESADAFFLEAGIWTLLASGVACVGLLIWD